MTSFLEKRSHNCLEAGVSGGQVSMSHTGWRGHKETVLHDLHSPEPSICPNQIKMLAGGSRLQGIILKLTLDILYQLRDSREQAQEGL